MKHLLIAAYILSFAYCYLQLSAMIDTAVDLFKERHPLIPMDSPGGWRGLRVEAEMIGISVIPVINLLLGCFIATLDESVIQEIINNVEINNWQDIHDAEKDLTEELDDLERKNEN